MRPEKMTDEALDELLCAVECVLPAQRGALRSHIAALTAERDAYRDSLIGAARFEMEWAFKDGNSPGYNIAKARNYGRQANEYRVRAETAEKERAALRERVQALEAKASHFEKVAKGADLNWLKACELAAIRQRAGELCALTLKDVMTGEWNKRVAAFMHYVLGEDEAGAQAPKDAPPGCPGPNCPMCSGDACKACGPGMFRTSDEYLPVGPVLVHCEHDAADRHGTTKAPPPERICEHAKEGQACETCHPPASHAPTTAEAFAKVRRFIERHDVQCGSQIGPVPCDCGAAQRVAALSLLERRVGAMDRAARLVLGCGGVAGFDKLRSALTDAPPVFTLEEVRSAGDVVAEDVELGPVVLTDDAAEAYASGWARGARTVADRLAALRKG